MPNETSCEKMLADYKVYLLREEKSRATVEKYIRDVGYFMKYIGRRTITKELTLEYKQYLSGRYAPASVNSMLAALNGFLSFAGMTRCKVRPIRIQRQLFCREERELSASEYRALLSAAKGSRLEYVIRTICGTGIRVSELEYITVEAVREGRTAVSCKNKTRVIFIPSSLQSLLKKYIKKTGVKTGSVFVSKGGRPLDRSNIWRDMKALCERAGVSPNKVFPHNLRHLFARTFYSVERDIVRLADLLGHSSINTTRIYTAEAGREHIVLMERVNGLLTT